jgi:hypothetical protein
MLQVGAAGIEEEEEKKRRMYHTLNINLHVSQVDPPVC